MRTMLRTFLLVVFTACVMLAGQANARDASDLLLQQEKSMDNPPHAFVKSDAVLNGNLDTYLLSAQTRCCTDQQMSNNSSILPCPADLGIGLFSHGLNTPFMNIQTADKPVEPVLDSIPGTVFRPPIS